MRRLAIALAVLFLSVHSPSEARGDKSNCTVTVYQQKLGAVCVTEGEGGGGDGPQNSIKNPAGTGLFAFIEKEWADAALKKYGGFGVTGSDAGGINACTGKDICGLPTPGRQALSAAQLALRASATLPLQAPGLGTGPTSEINGLKIDTAVGYPVWLWSEGNTGNIGASDSDGDLTVEISASIASVVYTMGDGTTLTCGTGTKWSKAQAGKPSPTCGHTYEKMGTYTITATTTWNADWVAAGETGSIELTRSTTRSYRVGEIQALIRKR